jgi:putative isomerase
MTGAAHLARLDGAFDLRVTPFTDALSRMLLSAGDDGFRVRLAEYETPAADRELLSGLALATGDGAAVPATIRAGAHRVELATDHGPGTITMLDPDRLACYPPPGLTVRFTPSPAAMPDRTGWRIPLDGPAIREAWITTTDKGTLLVSTVPPGDQPVPSREVAESAARETWTRWLDAAPPVDPRWEMPYARALAVLRMNRIAVTAAPGRIGICPSKQGYVALWNWDSYFHALGLRHLDPGLAAEQILLLLDRQLPNGMLPDVLHDRGIIATVGDLPPEEQTGFAPWLLPEPDRLDVEVTKPPLTAWAALRVADSLGDPAFLRHVYEPILRSQRWWIATCDRDGNGLYEYRHPFTHADDSPLWDGGGPLESPDLTAYLAMQWDDLAVIADRIGRPADALTHRAAAAGLASRLVAQRWDPVSGRFRATLNGRDVPADTPFNLMPLITGRLPRDVAHRTVATLFDPARFWTQHPVPSVSVADPAFTRSRMWRGPVWMNVNRLLIEALERSGLHRERAMLAERTLELALTQDDLLEYWDPIGNERPPRAAGMFGWSAGVVVDLAAGSI